MLQHRGLTIIDEVVTAELLLFFVTLLFPNVLLNVITIIV